MSAFNQPTDISIEQPNHNAATGNLANVSFTSSFLEALCIEAIGEKPTSIVRVNTGTQPVFRVGTQSKEIFLKFFTGIQEDQQAYAREVEAYKIIRESNSCINAIIPSLFRNRELCDAEFGEVASSYLAVSLARGISYADYRKINGQNEFVTKSLAHEIGRFLAEMHKIDVKNEVPWPMSWDALRQEHLQANFATIQNFGKENRESLFIEKMFSNNFIQDASKFLADNRKLITSDPNKLVFAHADLHQDHAFIEFNSDRAKLQLRVIDFADAGFYDPAYEFPVIYWDLLSGNRQLFQACLKSYVEHGGTLAPDFEVRAFTYSLLHRFDIYERYRNTMVNSFSSYSFQDFYDTYWKGIADFYNN